MSQAIFDLLSYFALPNAFLRRTLGRFPPRMHYQATPDSRAAPHFPRSHLAEAVAKAKAGGGSGGSAGGTGRGLVGQIIPIYGFGIFLYILYILF
uniref:Resistance to inhibitors of cholinesterase protein 3 N-terminal domain-containing protein n=1 Tax=Accipiter nisus TaxID=211598 RepID=A0A8B9N3V2_9AVES